VVESVGELYSSTLKNINVEFTFTGEDLLAVHPPDERVVCVAPRPVLPVRVPAVVLLQPCPWVGLGSVVMGVGVLRCPELTGVVPVCKAPVACPSVMYIVTDCGHIMLHCKCYAQKKVLVKLHFCIVGTESMG